MTVFCKKLLKWFWPILNLGIAAAASAGVVTFGAINLNDSKTFNLASNWNALLTLKLFCIAWAAQFFPLLLAYLKQSPLPDPDL